MKWLGQLGRVKNALLCLIILARWYIELPMLCHASGWGPRWPPPHNVVQRRLFGGSFVLTFLSLCLLQEAALAWGAIKSLMKRAEAFSLLLCCKDKRPSETNQCWNWKLWMQRKREWRRRERLWFRWLSSPGGQRWRGGRETSEGLWLACPLSSVSIIFVLFCFVVYRWTAVNDKRLRGCYLKWGSAIPPVRGYETQKRQASLQSRLRVEQKQEEEEEFC